MAKKHDEENLEKNNNELDENIESTNQTDENENDDNKEIKNSEEDNAAKAEIENLNNRLLRLQADFLNYKTRTEKEKVSTYSSAVSDLILDLLPVVDNLERALATEVSEGNSYREGVQMVYNQLMAILEKRGLKEVDALHKPFDHNLHFGVAFEQSENYEDGIITDVLQKGYTVNDKCIRPSMVRICKK